MKKVFALSAIWQTKTKQIKINGHACGTITEGQEPEAFADTAARRISLNRQRGGAGQVRRIRVMTGGGHTAPEGGGNLRKQNRKRVVPDR